MNGRRRIRPLTPAEAMYGAVLCLIGAGVLILGSLAMALAPSLVPMAACALMTAGR